MPPAGQTRRPSIYFAVVLNFHTPVAGRYGLPHSLPFISVWWRVHALRRASKLRHAVCNLLMMPGG